uniref:Uncharacterized protein n=1 Tax=Manihot esculenta TaxID=3983 RepID=A0A2C9WNT5_MANES
MAGQGQACLRGEIPACLNPPSKSQDSGDERKFNVKEKFQKKNNTDPLATCEPEYKS